MNLKLIVAIFVTTLNTALSQVTYTISPSTTINLTADLNQTTASKIYQINTGSSKILLKWERILVNLPIGWTYTSCDYGACYGGIPLGPNAMDSVPVGGQGMVGVDIDPGNILGSGVVKVFVYQDGYRNSGDTLTWNITSQSQAVGIKEISENSGISIYPNPVGHLLNIKLLNRFEQKIESVHLIDALGRIVKSIDLFDELTTLDISELNIGYYNLVIETEKERLFKIVIKSN